jgi:hypothetical protein
VKGWRDARVGAKHLARIVTYADDLVPPLCWKGKAEQALLRLRKLRAS